MIKFHNLSKSFTTKGVRKTIVSNLNMTLPDGRSLALLGRNGAGKSTLLELISGTLQPSSGRIERSGRVSWPLGFAGSFHPNLTGIQNTRFVARIYGVDCEMLINYVEGFAELGKSYALPLRYYSSGMKARLAFGLSMGISFDTYLIDEITAVGDLAFKNKCKAVLQAKIQSANVIMVSHSFATISDYCDCALILEKGMAVYYDNIEDAITAHKAVMQEGETV